MGINFTSRNRAQPGPGTRAQHARETNVEILRKLTIKNTGWTKGAILQALGKHYDDALKAVPDGKRVELFKIVGTTTQAKTGQTDLGEYVKLLGDFVATNLDTGETFQASQCILPNFVAESMAAALHTSQSVEFALQVDAVAKASAATGYEFSVKPLIEAEPTDKMRRLLLAAGIDPKAPPKLDAPTGDATKAEKGAKGAKDKASA